MRQPPPGANQPPPANCDNVSVGFVPLPDLGTGTYQGFQGGLYPGGANEPPEAYAAEGQRHAAEIVPRDDAGRPDPGGHVILLSIGMSNTTQEFSVFKQEADASPRKHPRLLIADGAQGGQDAIRVNDPAAPFWAVVERRLDTAGASARQVQVIWLKEAIAGEKRPFPDDARALQGALAGIVAIARQRYSNLHIVYLSSRIYAGYASTPLNPEPHAYDGGFAVKWLIEERIGGDPSSPWLAWGPYLWTDGTKGRRDGLIWSCEDVGRDGTHPSPDGMRKVAALLQHFFDNEPTAKSWFLKQGGQGA